MNEKECTKELRLQIDSLNKTLQEAENLGINVELTQKKETSQEGKVLSTVEVSVFKRL